MRKKISATILVAAALALLIGAFTPLFKPLLASLPPRSDLLFHLLAHAVLVLCAIHLVPPTVPAEVVCAASVAGALALEMTQMFFVRGRRAEIGDLAAATVGSFAVFLVPKDGLRFTRPSWAALTGYLNPEYDDEEEEDGHRVGSWAV